MDRATISSWVRQSRYRAKRHNIISDLDVADIDAIMQEHDSKCAYCSAEAETFDHLFPLKDRVANVPANIVPSCKRCKRVKKTSDLVWMYNTSKISEIVYITILKMIMQRRGNAQIKAYLQRVTGQI